MKLPRARIAVSVEGRHSCVVLGDGTVRCWGANNAGQLGNGVVTAAATPLPVAVSGVTTAVAVGAGRDHTCALLVTGRVVCWGANGVGELGDGTLNPSAVPVQVAGVVDAVSLSAGSRHTCARTATGRVRCWGFNDQGQIGDATRVDRPVPVDAEGLLDARAVSAGTNHTCAVRASGAVACWGGNASGQLGLGNTDRRTRPTDVPGVTETRHVSAGRSFTCAVHASGQISCWGTNALGQFGNGTTTSSLTPTQIPAMFFNTLTVSAGGEHACSMRASSVSTGNVDLSGPLLECWGQNASGQLGTGATSPAILTTPQRPAPFGAVMEYAAGSAHTCALMDDERVRCWGRNDVGQLGTGGTVAASLPTLVLGPIGSPAARGIAAGLNHSCAWRADGSAACWGRNASGQIGDGALVDRLTPVPVPLPRGRIFSMAGGDHHTCAASTLGRIECWGQNIDGQVGISPEQFVLSPTSFTTQMHTNLAAGSRHTIVGRAGRFATDIGATNGWGLNDAAQLGDVLESSSGLFISAGPMPLGVAVVAGTEHSCALAADGTVRCWGSNQFGQLGIGQVAPGPFAAPQQVVGVVDAVSIAAGPFHTCVVRVDGRVQCWGRNDFRQIGDGTLTDRRFPTAVPGISAGGAVALTLGRTHSCALTPSGGVRCWGRNDQGQLGDTTLTDRSSPVFVQMPTVFLFGQPLLSQATTLNQIAGIVAGQTHTCARRVSGRVFCWGRNVDGGIGDGSTTDRPIAVAVPSFTENMAPAATLSQSNRHLEVTALLNCEAGARFRVDISVTQGDARAAGHTQGQCTGGLERIPVTLNAHGREELTTGEATGSAVFEVTRAGTTLDMQEWTRKLQIAAADTESRR